MIELAVRWASALGLLALARWGGVPWELGWRIAAVAAAGALALHLVERHGLRGAGVSTAAAAGDAAAIALAAAAADAGGALGFLVLVPGAYAAARFGANSTLLAPLSVSLLVAAHNLYAARAPGPGELAQWAGILAIGLMLNQGRVVLTIDRTVEVPAESPALTPEPQDFLELRENFRRLREHCLGLERRAERDRLTASLVDAMFASGDRLPQRLAARFRELTGVEGVVIATAAMADDGLVVRAVGGEVDEAVRTARFPVSPSSPEALVRQSVDELLRALPDESRRRSANVVLKAYGRIVGVACLSDADPRRLREGVERAETAAPILGKLLFEDLESERWRTRARNAELLYAVAAVGAGSTTPATLAGRVVRELGDEFEADHLGVWMRDGDGAIPLASSGARCMLLEAMSFAAGAGCAGWYGVGMPELWLFDTAEDGRCPRAEAVKRRVGSYLAVPIGDGEVPFGFITVATHRAGGIDAPTVERVRTLAAEFGQALARLDGAEARGLALPAEFQAAAAAAGAGCLVVLEPLRREELAERYGAAMVENALRTLARRIRARLPAGGLLCRRPEGDLVAFLPDCAEPFARRWANEAAATAAMVGVGSPDGRHRVPLGLRARVAAKAPYSNQIPDAATAG